MPRTTLIKILGSVAFIIGILPVSYWANADADSVDVRLVIDVSGSMKQNDPNNLRQPAVELLLELAPEGSHAGVWTFGKWVNMLVPHKPVNESWKREALKKVEQINSAGLYTNIGEALEKAAYDSEYKSTRQAKHIILLTDGMVDVDKNPSKNKEEWRRIVDEVMPKLKSKGYRVHTVALSKNADKDLMNRLSVSTDGSAGVAETAEDLMRIFLKAFDAAAPAEQVALEGNQFVIDSSVEEFTALIFRQGSSADTQLVSPDNKKWTRNSNDRDLRWHHTANYDLITVKRPLEGQWGVLGDIDASSRITVVSNLNLRMKPLPTNVLKGDHLELSLMLQEDGSTITDPAFLSLMQLEAKLFAGHNDRDMEVIWQTALEPVDSSVGQYLAALPDMKTEGLYRVEVEVDGRTFSRRLTHDMTLRQPFGADIRETTENGQLVYVLTVNAYRDRIHYGQTQIIAGVTSPSGQKTVQPMQISELDAWQTQVMPQEEGRYEAKVQVKGMDIDGQVFEYELDPMVFNYSERGGMAESKPEFENKRKTEAAPPVAEERSEPEEEPKQADVKEEVVEQLPETASGLPKWVLYIAMGVGNVLLIGLGYFAYKKIMSGPKKDVLDEIEQAEQEVNESENETESEVVAPDEPDAADDGAVDEEPPMEDLDPDLGEDDEEPRMEDLDPETPEEADTLLGNGVETFDSPESEEMAAEPSPVIEDAQEGVEESTVPELEEVQMDAADQGDSGSEQADESDIDVDGLIDTAQSELTETAVADSPPTAELDDLEAMEVEEKAVASDAASDGEEDEDAMSEMLKAQGLDLAEDELDDAISSLIDDLDDEEESDEKEK